MVLCSPVDSWADAKDVVADVLQLVDEKAVTAQDYVRLGDAYLDLEDLGQARRAFDKAIQMGEEVLGHYGVGRVYAQTPGRGLKAQYHFRRALSKDPTFVDAQYHLAKLYVKMRPLEAEAEFEKSLEMAPDHKDAHFQLGQLLEDGGDVTGALVAYEEQIRVHKTHGEARYRMGKLLFAQGNQAEAVRLFVGLIKEGGKVGTRAYLEMALMSQVAQNFEGAQEFFRRYIDRLPPKEQDVYYDISLVATEGELATYKQAPDSLKRDLVRRFWASKDPAPLTKANERQIEHYRRVAYALGSFSTGKFPWDDRGEIYVRLGRPDHVSRFDDIQIELDPEVSLVREKFAARVGMSPPAGRPIFPIEGRWEYWVYLDVDGGTEFTFDNEFNDEQYRFADVPAGSPELFALLNVQGELMIRSLAAKSPSLYEADFADLPINFYYYPAGFRSEGGKTRLELYLGLPASEVSRLYVQGQERIVLERGVALYDSLWHEVHRVQDRLQFQAPSDAQIQAGAFIPGVMPVDLAPGTYQMALQVRDDVSGNSQVYRQEIVLEDYAVDTLLKVSDIELAFVVTPTQSVGQFSKNGLQVVPMSSKAFRKDQSAYVYFEVYNLKADEFGQSHYEVEYTVRSYKERAIPARILHGLGRLMRLVEKDQQVVIAYAQTGRGADEIAYVELDLRETEPGEQLVQVKVKDVLTEQEVMKEIRFKIVP